MINLFEPYIPKETIEAVSDVLRSRFIGQGPKVDQFEKEFEKFFNVKYAVSVNSGTSALETAYDLIGLQKGDTVISTPLTCTATNLPLLHRGCKIVWADILEDTLTIDPEDVKRKITEKIKAVIQVHLGGVKADVGKLDIPIISDAAQALGIFTGSYTTCSFQAIKHISTPDLGMIILNNAEEAHKAKLMRWFGIDREAKQKNSWKAYVNRMMTFDIEMMGYKRQPNDMVATMAIVGLKHYHEVLNHRKKIFNIYKEQLKNIDGLKLIDGKENVYWLATLLVKNRDEFSKMMFEADVDVNLVQIRNDRYKIFGKLCENVPIMDKIESQYLSIPIGMNVSENDANYICDTIKKGW